MFNVFARLRSLLRLSASKTRCSEYVLVPLANQHPVRAGPLEALQKPSSECDLPPLANKHAQCAEDLVLNMDVAQASRQRMHDGEDPCGHHHYSHRSNWLRAGILGANDGLVSVGALMVGIGGGSAAKRDLILAGVSGLVAGALHTGTLITVCRPRRCLLQHCRCCVIDLVQQLTCAEAGEAVS